jgi:hypothetical protein
MFFNCLKKRKKNEQLVIFVNIKKNIDFFTFWYFIFRETDKKMARKKKEKRTVSIC